MDIDVKKPELFELWKKSTQIVFTDFVDKLDRKQERKEVCPECDGWVCCTSVCTKYN